MSTLHEPVLDWYGENARDLPWRRPGTSPWAVMVSEFMLQQTPVIRVLPVYETWLTSWPTPADLAAVASGEAVRAWGRLGYPRRALRLHACAVAITEQYGDRVPDSYDELRTLPGVGDYTAAAIASFAFGRRHAELGAGHCPAQLSPVHRAGRERPPRPPGPARGSARRRDRAVMELGALICTATSPRCDAWPPGVRPTTGPITDACAWVAASEGADV